MGFWSYDSKWMRYLTRVGSLLELSLLWLVCCLPMVTVIPACAALFHTTVHIVAQDRPGAVTYFWKNFCHGLGKKIILGIGVFTSAVILITCLDLGRQLSERTNWGFLYLGAVWTLALLFLGISFHLPYVCAELEIGKMSAVRVSLYFTLRFPLKTCLMGALLALCVLGVWFYAPVIFLAGAAYPAVTRKMWLKALQAFAIEQGLYDADSFALEYFSSAYDEAPD